MSCLQSMIQAIKMSTHNNARPEDMESNTKFLSKVKPKTVEDENVC